MNARSNPPGLEQRAIACARAYAEANGPTDRVGLVLVGMVLAAAVRSETRDRILTKYLAQQQPADVDRIRGWADYLNRGR
jgi:hypothetical protein